MTWQNLPGATFLIVTTISVRELKMAPETADEKFMLNVVYSRMTMRSAALLKPLGLKYPLLLRSCSQLRSISHLNYILLFKI